MRPHSSCYTDYRHPWKLWNLNEKADSTFFPHWDGLTGDQNDTNWVSVGIGWGIGGSCLCSFKNMQKVQTCMSGVKAPQKAHKKERKWSPIWNWWPLFIWTWIMYYGVSVLGGPLSVMQVWWAASRFKATSYYSVHPIILSATHISLRHWLTYFQRWAAERLAATLPTQCF